MEYGGCKEKEPGWIYQPLRQNKDMENIGLQSWCHSIGLH